MITTTTLEAVGIVKTAGLASTAVITTTTLESKTAIDPGADPTAVITTTTLEAVGIAKTAGLSSSAVVTVSGAIKATSFETAPDARLKQNHALSSERLRNLLSVQGVSFQWRREQFPERNFGNADDVRFPRAGCREVFPQIVRGTRTGGDAFRAAFEPLLMEGFAPRSADRAARGGRGLRDWTSETKLADSGSQDQLRLISPSGGSPPSCGRRAFGRRCHGHGSGRRRDPGTPHLRDTHETGVPRKPRLLRPPRVGGVCIRRGARRQRSPGARADQL